MEKKLCKSKDKKLCGVLGGIAEYFGIDVTITRLIGVLLILFTGVGLVAYIVAALLMPKAE
ncbi:MAG: PspC domain-containing protein [Clostridia bacterium]|nr:PspC domain-containing protein [Clostridia bacterium]